VRRAGGAFAAVLALTGATGLAGQAGPPVRWLGIKDFGVDVELRYESEDRERTGKETESRTRFSDRSFHEIFELSWKGYLYHPRFVDFSATLGFDVEQSRVSLETPGLERSDSRNATSPLYEVAGIFLSHHPVSLSFALDKRRSTTSLAFGELAWVDSANERATLHIKSDRFPTEVFLAHAQTHQDARSVGEGRDDEATTAGFVVNHTGERSTSRLSYEYEDRTEEITSFGGVPARFLNERRVHDLSLTNEYRFGAEKASSLGSRLSYRDETGTLSSNRFAADELLHLRHSPRLSSRYGLHYARDEVGETQADLLSERASLSHQLFESLFTTVEGHASQERFADSSRDIYGASLSTNYRKRIPHGLLLLSLGTGYETTDEQGGRGVRAVLDERHVLSDVTTTLLQNSDITEGSLVVTDAAGTTTYLRDSDYRILSRGSRTELRRLPTGTIPDGATVLVDYSYAIETPLEYATRLVHGRAQVDLFDCLSLYAGRSSTTQELLSGIDEGRLQDVHDTIYGGSLRVGPATLTAEHEIHDSTQAPFTSDMVSLDLSHTVAKVHNVSANATHRHVTFDAGQDSTLRSLSATYRFTPRSGPSVRITGGHEQRDDRGLPGQYTFARIEASYRIRATEFSGSFRLNRRDDDFALDLSHYFFFSVRRSF
jgi:hypothetical protein